MYIIIASLCTIVYGGLPVSYPNIKNKWLGGKLTPYNMIDTNPSCYERGFCPMFPPGGRLSAFPNSEEKYQSILRNIFRMFANVSLDLKYCKWMYGVNKNAGLTYYCKAGCSYCGKTHPRRKPLYWYSDANQAARFKQYDENSCDQDWYEEPGITAHHTCNWVLPEYGGGSHCDLFDDDCGFGARAGGFCHEDRCWFETEGICGGATCLVDPHCEPIFANKYDYQGAGFVEGMNGASGVYSRFTKEIYYVLPSASHFDERMKIVEEDRDPDGKYFTLMLQYFDYNDTQMPSTCWSIYNGSIHEMDVLVSEVGDADSGFSINSYSVMFTSNHDPPTECEPYSFICKTSLGNFFRLPEENSYYFGTEWIDWVWSNYTAYGPGYTCKENHYYFDETEDLWIVNGGPDLHREDIWYYKDIENYGTCIGCYKIAKLECNEACILSDFNDCKDCDDIVGQKEPPPLSFDDDDVNVGGIVAGILCVLICILFVLGFVYYRKQTGKTLCPTPSEMECKCKFPAFGGSDEPKADSYAANQGKEGRATTVNYVQ